MSALPPPAPAPSSPSVPDDERRLAALVRLAALAACVPTAVVNLFVADWQCQTAAFGLAAADTPLVESMCWSAVQDDRGAVLHHVPDASLDPRLARNPWVDGRRAHVRLYVSVPLRAAAGALMGTLCLFDDRPGHLTRQQQAAVADLARDVAALVEHREYAAQWQRLAEEADAARAHEVVDP